MRRFLRWLLFTTIKLSIVGIFILAFYVVYLDGKVQQKFEGKRWEIPVQVFSKVAKFSNGSDIRLDGIKNQLIAMGYRKVSKVASPGDFALSKSRLIVFRRSFDFGEGTTPPKKLTIDVKNNRVTQVFENDEIVTSVKLEPSLLDRIVPENKEDRLLVGLESVPESLIDTLLLVEDRDFYFHSGISPLGILRALYQNILAGRTVQGGSTLTQQLVKNMFLTRQKTLTRKANEALMSLILEYRYSKDQLLEAYINEVYLGQHFANGIYGFGLAAKFYFGRSLSQLSPEQIALLIGQIKGPSYYDPWRHPERAKKRRDLILRLMFEQHFIDKRAYQLAVNSGLNIRVNRRFVREKQPAYMQLVKQELSEKLADYSEQSGIRVFTGFSHDAQSKLESTVETKLVELDKLHGKNKLQAAMIVTDIHTGEIQAVVGDRNSKYSGFNRALNAKRPIGSLIKPAVYIPALERYEQYNLATPLADKAITLNSDKGKAWSPKNYDGQFRGQVPLLDGLVKSLNVPTVNLGMVVGLNSVSSALNMLGYEQEITLRPSMLLGAVNMSPLEVSQIYLPIASRGFYQPVHAVTKIISNQGETLFEYTDEPERRVSENTAFLLDYALVQVAETGTAKSLTWRLGDAVIAGKTGTSNDLRDSWFVGYDENTLVTTWVGYDDNKPSNLTGSSGALVLFADLMKKLGTVNRDMEPPESVSMVKFELVSGNAVKDDCKQFVEYPAVSSGVTFKECSQQSEESKSWLERIFGS